MLIGALFESAPIGIALIDHHGLIVGANPALAELLGCDAADLSGQHFDSLDSLYAGSAGAGLIELPHPGVEKRFFRKDGKVAWCRSSTWAIPSPAQGYTIGIVEDIGRRHRAEEKLREQQTLAEIGKMAAVVAHQVKNPLAGISGAVQIIRDRFPPGAAERQILDEIRERLLQLDDTVDALVRYARASEPVLSNTVLADVVTAATARIRDLFPRVEIAAEIDPAVRLKADPVMLESLVGHLLKNAAQAMDGAGRIDVDVASGDGECALRVRDRGPGCRDREEIFAPFFSTRPNGVGLGLAVARRIARAHGGEVLCEDSDAGAVFQVRLPLSPPG